MKFAVERDEGTEVCRSPHGERGLKWYNKERESTAVRRSPHGERGLKLGTLVFDMLDGRSLPARGAWVEMWSIVSSRLAAKVAPRTGSVG